MLFFKYMNQTSSYQLFTKPSVRVEANMALSNDHILLKIKKWTFFLVREVAVLVMKKLMQYLTVTYKIKLMRKVNQTALTKGKQITCNTYCNFKYFLNFAWNKLKLIIIKKLSLPKSLWFSIP